MAGHNSAEETIAITRETSAAERAAEAAAQEQLFKSQATSIPYAELNKNPEAFNGKIVTYTGQIFQIHEETEGGGWMLLSVTQEYELWSNNIYVRPGRVHRNPSRRRSVPSVGRESRRVRYFVDRNIPLAPAASCERRCRVSGQTGISANCFLRSMIVTSKCCMRSARPHSGVWQPSTKHG